MTEMLKERFHIRIAVLILTCIVVTGGVFTWLPCRAQQSDDVRAPLFGDADQVLELAKSVNTDLLAPRAFQRGMEDYQAAEKMFERGKEIGTIRAKLDSAIANFRSAIEAVKVARVAFADTLVARENALAAEAPIYENELWSQAEGLFNGAAGDLEKGYMNQAKKDAARAAERYNDAELKAIKKAYLSKGFQLIEQAKMADAEKFAPKTLKHSQDLIQQAESKLTANRYQTEEPKDLASEAQREALHAITISKIARNLKDSNISVEDLILKHEELLLEIGKALDIGMSFEEGLEESVTSIVKTIEMYQEGEKQQLEALQERVQKLSKDVESRDDKIMELNSELSKHASMLRSAEEEAFTYQQKVAQQEEIKQTFLEMERMFDPSKATVLRRENEILIQLFGLNFPSGKSTIEPQNFSLLTKVQDAIDLFPKSNVIVAGHTDSIGDEKKNLQLSQERAETVRQYLLANMGISEERIKAVGYGESQPLASNDTKEGRERNRRIDIIIQPQF